MKPTDIPIPDNSISDGEWDGLDDADDGAALPAIELQLTPEACGVRLDKAISALVPQYSRSRLQQWIEAGHVSVDGEVARAKMTLYGDEKLVIRPQPAPEEQAFKAEPMDLAIVHEDDAILVVNKPVGLVVHPAAGNWSGTLLNGLLHHFPAIAGVPRAGIVHRLDKDTSGLMVVARERQTMDALVKLIAARDVRRNYLALGHKPWQGAAQTSVSLPIGRDPRNRLRMAAVDLAQHPGKPARTDIRLLVNGQQGCAVFCSLHTGRTHQIRVHMASLQHPLLADTLYGGTPAAGMERQALHALRLAFVHPVTGQSMSWFAMPPADITSAMENWDLRYNLAELA